MRRRDFLKAFAALPLVGPLVASAAERPAKVILAGSRSGKSGHPTFGRRTTGTMFEFAGPGDGDNFDIPEDIGEIVKLHCACGICGKKILFRLYARRVHFSTPRCGHRVTQLGVVSIR